MLMFKLLKFTKMGIISRLLEGFWEIIPGYGFKFLSRYLR